jgi:serine protease AprX
MATGVVSGAAALLLERRPNLTPNQVKALLVGTTQQYGQDSGKALPDPIADGSGLLDAYAVMTAARDMTEPDDVLVPLVLGTLVPGALLPGALLPGALLPDALLPDALQPLVGFTCANDGLRPADGFARALFPVLFGSPLHWKDPTLGGIPWFLLTWDTLVWNSIAWDNFAWDSVAWDSVAWDRVAWDSVAWDSVAWDSVAWDSVAWDSFTLD